MLKKMIFFFQAIADIKKFCLPLQPQSREIATKNEIMVR